MKKDRVFIIIGEAKRDKSVTDKTLHTGDRMVRLAKVEELIRNENATEVGAWEVDTDHPNGHEIHVVYNNGCIKIYNKRTGKYITALIGRVPQVERYGIKPTKTMLKKIKKHLDMGYNMI